MFTKQRGNTLSKEVQPQKQKSKEAHIVLATSKFSQISSDSNAFKLIGANGR